MHFFLILTYKNIPIYIVMAIFPCNASALFTAGHFCFYLVNHRGNYCFNNGKFYSTFEIKKGSDSPNNTTFKRELG